MNMQINNINENMFSDINPTLSESINGGANIFSSTVSFDQALRSRNFNISGGDLSVSMKTSSTGKNVAGNTHFFVQLYKDVFGPDDLIDEVSFRNSTNSTKSFKNLAGGEYYLKFTDEKSGNFDGEIISGSVTVA